MLKRLKKFLSHGLLALLVLFGSAQPVLAQTQSWSGVCVAESLDDSGDVQYGQGEVATIQGLECLIANVFTVIITVIGLAGFVMFIFGAVRYMFSGGNTQHAQTARQMMTYSVIGLVVALSAFIIINLIANFTGVSIITRFGIPTSDFQY